MAVHSASKIYHALSCSEIIENLKSNAQTGLCAEEVALRYEKYGRNELQFKPGKPEWLRFLLQFHQPLLYILLLAGTVKALLGSWINATVIWGVTVINAVIGYVQETKAEGAIASLSKVLTTETIVLREGQPMRIPARDLVPGDLVVLTSGDKVPADLRLLRVRNLQVDESALTGESVPVEKSIQIIPAEKPLAERQNMAYAGSFVTLGQGEGIVVATGNRTEVGEISRSMESRVSLSTPLTRKFEKFSHTLLYAILTLATFTFVVGLGHGKSWVNMFEVAVALAVSAIPEGLPAVVTIALAIGVNRMAKRNAIIRKLPAVEALGSATVICSDKTGTLTENQMTVQAIYAGGQHYRVSGGGYSPKGDITLVKDENQIAFEGKQTAPVLTDCLMAGVLCNDSRLKQMGTNWSVVGDPTEGALIAVAEKAGITQVQLTADKPRLDAIPFESDYQYMATLHNAESRIIYVKGSVEALLSRCTQMLDAQEQQIPLKPTQIKQEVETMTSQGLRVLAFAQKFLSSDQHTIDHEDIATDLVFLGLQGMIDPPRPEAIAAVHVCQSACIQVKMVTGDHIGTARAIAQRMGIKTAAGVIAFSGQQLAQMNEGEIKQAAAEGSVFARVTPFQKLQLVEALQAQGHIVAMTGDGVNDAPALKKADIGIAMGKNGTEVARESADMLLTDDNFASIEAAVEQGRTVYQNLRKAIAFLLPVNGGESMTILISSLLARELPILPLQVLWLNMINSITMTVPLAFEPISQGTMGQPPRNPNEGLLTSKLLGRIVLVSLFNWILIFGIFEWVKVQTANIVLARTMAIQALVAARMIYLISISQLGTSIVQYFRGRASGIPNVPILILGTTIATALQILFSQWSVMNVLFATAPLTSYQWLVCLLPILPMIPIAVLSNWIDPSSPPYLPKQIKLNGNRRDNL
ncbi:cation-transporting P-type ATPase [Cylindrospermopsis raciborskii]|uniref:cation-transporting P-type ATPase n=1 Tax=Cylindrospermopsis raciborskii TaxID=77022 RepID=UPI000B5E2A7F|nr:cation-transporting P-type ATPase [Cylindrospermopsis raciborskii]UJL34816.1 cation-transporting P-type ATPase [Cylindrospermopsis raciborskii Cr2010]UJS04332.1 cation-transporting P-type ATPase [Cylindrospermopsis raciborskii KLL07]BAZ90278.1 cation-transporting P-type ATPase [Raphidiopsis curvata NIES-932]